MSGDRRKMIEFIARQLPDGEATLVLASGPHGRLTATVAVRGDDLDIESNCPEWVTLREVYAHLRWHSMPDWEQRDQLGAGRIIIPAPTRLELIAERLRGVLDGLGRIHGQTTAQATTPPTSPEQFLRIRDVAALLGCSYSEARDRLLDGRIRAIRDGRWLRTRREWVEEYVTKKLVQAPASVPEIHVVRVRKPRKAQAVFRKGGAGYEFLKERQRNQRQRGQG
jgi:excisionase family DNA binding protein